MAIWLKAMGVASSLGGLHQASAAFRAGMRRPAPAPDMDIFFVGDEEPGEFSILPLGAPTYGFSGVGRLCAIATEALADLAAREDLAALDDATTLHVALPDPEERAFTTGKDPEDEDPEEAAERLAALADRVLAPAFTAAGVRWKLPQPRLHAGGNAAVARALAAVEEELREGRVRRALILGVDSFCSPSTLKMLVAEQRIKTDDRPTGVIPGEAGLALLVEPPPSRGAETGDRPVLLKAAAFAEGQPYSPEEAQPSDGRALAECLRAALGPLPPGEPPPLLISDHDGQEHRAQEWGLLQLRLTQADPRLGDCPAWMPALSFGHTGVASGGLGVAVAMRGLQRGYAPTGHVLVLSSSDEGQRAALHFVAG